MTNRITTNGITDQAILDRVPINQVFSETFTRDTDFSGVAPSFTLSQTPISSVHVFVNMGSASLIDEDITVIGNVVTVDSGVPLDVDKVQIKYIAPQAISVSDISDGVVTFNKLSAGLRGSELDIANAESNKVAMTASVKDYIDSVTFGINQTWQDVTTSRAESTTYTNNTGKAIVLLIRSSLTTAINGIIFTVDGVDLPHGTYQRTAGSGSVISENMVIPAGSTYSVNISDSALDAWWELRG